MSRGGPDISHLLFVDDVMLFCRASSSQVNLVMETLNNFCEGSGLKVNLEKSKAMCSPMISRTRRDELSNLSAIDFVNDLGSYLGFPLIRGRASKKHYSLVVERVQRHMASWKGMLLNKAGKVCLIKSVLSSIPIYPMQTHLHPTSICRQIDTQYGDFVWGRDMHHGD